MKSYSNLFGSICSFENLYLASRQAERGKRYRHEVALFNTRRFDNLLEIQRLLQAGTYPFGTFHTIKIHQPKPRVISAAPYRDRVAHHALINIIGPLFERTFIRDSYANQTGKGTHAALDRCTYYARRHSHVLQLDIYRYFPSIDLAILFEEIKRKIRCKLTLALVEKIIRTSNPQEPIDLYFPGDDLFTPFERSRGLPIGNLTSQFFANVYLNPLDHFIKEVLRVPGYVRYVDDLLLFDDNKQRLHEYTRECQTFLCNWRMLLHPRKRLVYPVTQGIPFLGFRVFPTHRKLLKGGIKRARARLRTLNRSYAQGSISWARINASMQAWLGHVKHGDTWRLRRALFEQYVFRRQMPNSSLQI